MSLLNTVKPRLGIYYSETNKDAEVQGMIDAAIEEFRDGGWIIDPENPTAYATEMIILSCKMKQSTDPAASTNHPVLISAIANKRIQPLTCVTPTADPAAGTYSGAQSVTLATTTPGATILYTTDGTAPNDDSTVYTGPIAISQTTTIKAMARATAHYDSAVLTTTYTIAG